jgi:hypothetical protein
MIYQKMVKNVKNYEKLEMQMNWLKDACECQTQVSIHPFCLSAWS